MAENPIKKSDIADFEGIQKAVNELIASLEKLSQVTHKELKESADAVAKSLQGISASSVEGQAAISNAAKATEGLMAEQKQLVAVDRQLTDARAKLNTLQNEGVQQKIKETSETKKAISEKQKEITQGKAAADSYVVLIAKLKQLRDAWKLAGESGRKELTPQIQKIDKQLKDLDKSIGQHQRNVGNYGTALKGLGANILAATGLTAGLAGGIKAIGAVIKSTNAGADRMEFFLGGVREGIDFLGKAISNLDFKNLVSGFKDAYAEGKRYAEALADIDDLQGALGLQKEDIETEILRQRVIARNRQLDLDQRQAAIDEIVRLEQLKLEKTQEVNDKALDNALKHAEENTQIDRKVIIDYVKNADQYIDKVKEIAETNERLKKQAEETTYTQVGDQMIKSTRVNMQKYIDSVKELSKEEQYYLELLKLDRMLTGDKTSGIRGEVIKALADQTAATNEQLRSEEELVMFRNRLYNELIKEEKKETKVVEDEAKERQRIGEAALKKRFEDLGKENQKKAEEATVILVGVKRTSKEEQEITDATNTHKLEQAQITMDKLRDIKLKDVESTEESEKAKADFIKQTNKEILRDQIAAAEGTLQIMADASVALGDIMTAQKNRELSAAGDNAQKREEIERDYFKKQKALSIAQAIINGALAVTKVTAQTGVLAPLAIPLIIGTTLAQIALIASQKFAEGGYTGDGSYRDETGQRVAGIVHEKEFVLDRDSTKKYRPLIEAIHEDDPAKIAAIVSNEHMHNIWGNMNKAMGSSQDPYTRLMYDLMKSQPSIYIDTDGNTVLQYVGRKQVIRKN